MENSTASPGADESALDDDEGEESDLFEQLMAKALEADDEDDIEDLDEEVNDLMRDMCISDGYSLPVPHAYELDPPGQPNPFYNFVSELREKNGVLIELMNEVKTIANNHRCEGDFQSMWDFKGIMEDVDNSAIPQKFADICKLQEVETPELPPIKPDRKDLYGRLEVNAVVTDVGSGGEVTRNMLSQVTENATLVDPAENSCADVKAEIKNVPIQGVCTSFNTLTQLDEENLDAVKQHFGLHIYPDVHWLLERGFSKWENGKAKYTDMKGLDWYDYVRDYEGDSRHVEGYRCLNNYLKHTGWVQTVGPGVPSEVDIDTMSTNGLFVSGDFGHKLDGVFYQLELGEEGEGYLTDRGGTEVYVKHNLGLNATLHLEKVKGRNRVHWYVIRVVYYSGAIPFHGTEHLYNFVRNHDITIDSIKIEAPPRYNEERVLCEEGDRWLDVIDDVIPIDGIIQRGSVDVYWKWTWTVDLKDVPEFVRKWSTKFNLVFEPEEVNAATMREFKMIYDGSAFRFEKLRERNKKTENGDKQIAALFRLAQIPSSFGHVVSNDAGYDSDF